MHLRGASSPARRSIVQSSCKEKEQPASISGVLHQIWTGRGVRNTSYLCQLPFSDRSPTRGLRATHWNFATNYLSYLSLTLSQPQSDATEISRFPQRSEQSPQSRLAPPSLGMKGLPGALAVLRGVIVLLAVTHLVQVIPTVEGCGLYACKQLRFLAWGCQADRARTIFSSQADCDPRIAFFSLPTIE